MTYQVVETENSGAAYYNETVTLDGVDFILLFKFNARDETWYMTIRTEDNEPIQGCEGIRLVQDGRALHCVTDANSPQGAFYVLGPSSEEPGLFDLGDNSTLIYIPEEDLNA